MIDLGRAYRLAAVIALLFSAGCRLFSDGTDWKYSPMYPREILSIGSAGNPERVIFEIASFLNTPCNEYSHADIRREGSDIFVKFYQRVDGHIVCTQNVVDTQIIWSFKPSLRGEYGFHFWRSDSTSLDTTITIR